MPREVDRAEAPPAHASRAVTNTSERHRDRDVLVRQEPPGALDSERAVGQTRNSLGGLDQFLKEEVEAAQMMYDAFRAIKGADGSVIDTRDWSEGTAIRVKVRSPATRPLKFRRIARCRISRIIRVVTTHGRR